MGAGTSLQCIPIVAESRIPQQKSYLVALEGHTPQLSSYFPMLATTAPGSHLHRSAFGWWAHEPGTAVCGQWQGTGAGGLPGRAAFPVGGTRHAGRDAAVGIKRGLNPLWLRQCWRHRYLSTVTETAAEGTCPLINFLGSTAEEEAKAGSKSRN